MSFLKNVSRIGLWTILSRIAGFGREILTAYFLGVGLVVDALVIAMKIPSFVRRITAEGSMNACFIPLYSEVYATKGHLEAQKFAGSILSLFVIFLLLFSALIINFAEPIITTVFSGLRHTPERLAYTIYFTQIITPFTLFISITAIYGGVLNAKEHFTAFAASPFFGNLTIIILAWTAFMMCPSSTLLTKGAFFAVAILISGCVQALVVIIDAYRKNLLFSFAWPLKTKALRSFFKRLGPSALGSGIAQVNLMVGLLIASWLPSGNISYLNYADRLSQLPLSVIGTAMGVAILPLLSKALAKKKTSHANSAQEMALAIALALSVFVVIYVTGFSRHIVTFIYQYGAFKESDAFHTSNALLAYIWGLPAYVSIKILSARFFAKGMVGPPLLAGLLSVVSDIILSILLSRIWGHVGIAIATSLAAWINVSALLVLLHTKKQWHASKDLKVYLLKMALLASIFIGFGILGSFFIPFTSDKRILILILILSSLVLLFSFFGLLYLVTSSYLKKLKRQEKDYREIY